MSECLELNFNDKSLSLAEGNTPEWIGGNNYYKVKINISESDKYDYFHIILADNTNKQVIEVGVAILENFVYTGKFYVPRVLGNNTKVNLGIIAKKTSESNAIVSSPLTVTIKSGIAQPVPFFLEEEDVNNSGFTSLLNLLEDGKVLKDITLVDKVVNGSNGQYLKVQLQTKGESEDKYLGPLTQNLVHLGAQIERNGETGGGGKLGYNSTLTNSKAGFAGGYSATTGVGAAVGAEASSISGVAVGFKAITSHKTGGIAIGRRATVDADSANSIAIGDQSEVTNSPRTILISSVTDDKKAGTIKNSERAVGLGYSLELNKVEDAIAIGTNTVYTGVRDTGTKTMKQDGIVIGREAAGALSGSIIIGPEARAGFKTSTSKEILTANTTDETKGWGISRSDWRSFGGIAIGTKAFARRGGGIALGRFAKTYDSNSIAIGSESNSGNKDFTYDDWDKEKEGAEIGKNGMFAIAIGGLSKGIGLNSIALGREAETTGKNSVAIGYKAKATAEAAVQIGEGTNDTANSLKFKDIYIVKDGVLQTGGSSSSSTSTSTTTTKVTHPLKKIEAKENAEIAFKDVSSAAKNKKGVTKTVKFDSAFSKKPNVVCSFRSDSSALYDLGLSVISISKESFTYKITANPNYKSSSSAKIGVQWIAVVI